MADLAQFEGLTEAQDAGLDVNITHPKTRDDLGIVIKVAGPDSDRVKKARAALMDSRIRTRKTKAMTMAEIESESLRLTASAIISWSGVTESGKDIEFNPQNAEKLLAKYPFIREQIDEMAGDRAGFIKS